MGEYSEYAQKEPIKSNLSPGFLQNEQIPFLSRTTVLPGGGIHRQSFTIVAIQNNLLAESMKWGFRHGFVTEI